MNKITGIVTKPSPRGGDELYLDVDQDGHSLRVGPIDRRSLLEALDAEPDESDYREVVDSNLRLGDKLSAALKERDNLARRNEELLARARDAEERIDEVSPAPEPGDRAAAIEKASDVLGGLAAVGAIPERAAWASLFQVAEWILSGQRGDDES